MLNRIPPPFAASAAGGSVSSGTVVFSNSNGLSFGLNGSTLTASHNALTTARASTDAVGLNTAQTNVTWTVNSSGISVNAGGYAGTGLTTTTTAGTAIIGTHNTAGLSLGVPAFLTAGGFSAGVSTGGNTAGNTGVSGTRLVLVGNPNITLSQNTDANGATVTISGGAGAAGNTGFLSANATASLGTVVLSNLNGFTWGIAGQTLTASYTVPTQTVESQSIGMSNVGNTSGTTGMASGGQVRFVLAGGNNVTLSQSLNGASGTITISAFNQTVQTQGITGDQLSLGLSNLGNTQGNTTVQTGNRLVLVGTNGVTLSQATGAGSTTISISGNPAQTNQSAIKGLGASNTGNTAGNTGLSTGIDWVLAGSNNITISQSTAGGGPNTLWVSGPTVGGAQTGISGIQVSDTTYTSGTVTFRNANGISFGSSGANGISASYTVPTVTSWTVSDSATSATVGRLAFTASNGLTLTLSTSNNGNHTVIGSYTVPTVTNSSMTVSDAATSGTLARLAFTNLNGVTLSLSTGAGGSHTIVGSHNALTSQSGQGASASNGSFAFQTLAFSNANNVTFGTSAGSIITASVAAPGAAAENNWFTLTGAAAGNVVGNSSASGSTIGLSAINLTLSGTNNSQIAISAPATSSLSGTGIVSLSTNGSTISIGAPGFSAGVSTGGNTAGNTGVSGSRLVLVGSQNISLSQLTDASGLTVSFSGGATSSLSASGIVSIVTNGATISIGAGPGVNVYAAGNTFGTSSGTADVRTLSVVGGSGIQVAASNSGWVVGCAPASTYAVYPVYNVTNTALLSCNTNTSGSASFVPFELDVPVAAGWLQMAGSMSFVTIGTSKGSQTVTLNYGLYTRGTGANSSTMSAITSNSFSVGVSQSNSTITINQPTTSNNTGFGTGSTTSAGMNITSGYTGLAMLQLPINTTLTPGYYWLGLFARESSSSVAGGFKFSYLGHGDTLSNMAPIGSFSSAYTTGTNILGPASGVPVGGNWHVGHGVFTSAGQTNLPGSLAFSAMSANLTVLPFMKFMSTQ